MSPAAMALETPSHLRVGCFAKANGTAPSPVAAAVISAKRKTEATPADDITRPMGSHALLADTPALGPRRSSRPLGRDASLPQAPGQARAFHRDEGSAPISSSRP